VKSKERKKKRIEKLQAETWVEGSADLDAIKTEEGECASIGDCGEK
jgi:hypothetical protein